MKLETSVRITKEKTKVIINLSPQEFKEGKWLKYVPNSKNLDVKYTARTGVLIVLDTPKLQVAKREV